MALGSGRCFVSPAGNGVIAVPADCVVDTLAVQPGNGAQSGSSMVPEGVGEPSGCRVAVTCVWAGAEGSG